jgi:hypothetical protein
MATALEIMEALAAQIDNELALIPDLQVVGGLVWNPTPPTIDIFPADPFEQLIAYGNEKALFFVVRARVDTPDREGAQALLLSMMDSRDTDHSVEVAILSDDTLGGLVQQITVEAGPAEFGAFVDPGGSALVGTTWQTQVLP